MLRCFVDSKQSDWDVYVNKIFFAYNTSVHFITRHTPFELRFGVQPRIPCDLIYGLTHNSISTSGEEYVNEPNEPIEPVIELVDTGENLNPKLPEIAQTYANSLKSSLEEAYKLAAKNKDLRMEKAKLRHYRNIRKYEYQVGELVLTDHPRLSKGVSTGLAHKYYGPFVIVSKHPNGVNYSIRQLNKRRAKIFQIHKNRLKKRIKKRITVITWTILNPIQLNLIQLNSIQLNWT